VAGMLISAIQHDQKLVWPCSTVLHGEYGQTDVACGVPCVIGRKGIEKVLEVQLLPEEQEKLNKSCDILRSFLERADNVK
jgi:L-lactate dehydrogenase